MGFGATMDELIACHIIQVTLTLVLAGMANIIVVYERIMMQRMGVHQKGQHFIRNIMDSVM